MLKLNNSLKNVGGNLLKLVIAEVLADGNRLCHCGNLKEMKNKNLFPSHCEWVRMKGLTEREQLEILRSSSINLLQSNSLSLRMTNAIDNLCKGGYAEFISASLACAFGQRFRNKFGMTINHNKSCHILSEAKDLLPMA